MGRFDPVNVDIIVGHHRTSDRSDRYGDVFRTHFLDHFCNEFVDHSVGASGAIVHGVVVEQAGLGLDYIGGLFDFFRSHDTYFSMIFLRASSTSEGSMTIPPMRP